MDERSPLLPRRSRPPVAAVTVRSRGVALPLLYSAAIVLAVAAVHRYGAAAGIAVTLRGTPGKTGSPKPAFS